MCLLPMCTLDFGGVARDPGPLFPFLGFFPFGFSFSCSFFLPTSPFIFFLAVDSHFQYSHCLSPSPGAEGWTQGFACVQQAIATEPNSLHTFISAPCGLTAPWDPCSLEVVLPLACMGTDLCLAAGWFPGQSFRVPCGHPSHWLYWPCF